MFRRARTRRDGWDGACSDTLRNVYRVAISLGIHSPKIDAVRALRTPKGRNEQGCFLIEGPTMLAEALRSGVGLEAIYATQAALDALERMLEARDTPVYLLP